MALLRVKVGKHLCAIAWGLISFSGAVHGYVLQGNSWPTGKVVILHLDLGSPGHVLQDGNTSWIDAIAPAAETWNQVIQRIQFSSLESSPISVSLGDGLNSVVFSNDVFGQSFGRYALAVTISLSINSQIVESDTLFNPAVHFDSYRGPLLFPANGGCIADIRRVFLHELGHTLGLGHPDAGGQQVTAVMNSVIGHQEVLSADDLAGAQYLYGSPGNPSPTPGATPTPPPGATPTATPGTTPTATPSPTPIETPTPPASLTPTATPSATPAASPSPTPTATATVTPESPTGHLANLSTRAEVGTDENVLIGGFIIRGSQPKTLVLRAIGPSLTLSGIAHPLGDPVLQLHDSTGLVIASNDDWRDAPAGPQIQQSGLAPTDPSESAMHITLSPGAYTVVVRGRDGASGTGLVEAYEMDLNGTRMVNLSTRGRVGARDDAMIGGVITKGAAKRVLVRALGPSLAVGSDALGNALGDPILELRDGSGNLIAINDDWAESAQVAEILATKIAPVNRLEPAILVNLDAGNYTAIVRGFSGTSGTALVEVFDLEP